MITTIILVILVIIMITNIQASPLQHHHHKIIIMIMIWSHLVRSGEGGGCEPSSGWKTAPHAPFILASTGLHLFFRVDQIF